jgi:hypothetical protein
MHRGLPCSCCGLVPSTGAGSGASSGPCSAWSITKSIGIRHLQKCNAWSAKCNMMQDHEHLNHITLTSFFTKLPLHF